MMNSFEEVLPPIWDQGERNTCLAIALSDGHVIARKAEPFLSPEFLHFHSAKLCGVGTNDAVTLESGCEALSVEGQPEETSCPYSPLLRPLGWSPTPFATPIWKHSTAVANSNPFGEVEKCLRAGTAAALILRINDAFIVGASPSGVIDESRGADRGYHAVLAVGVRANPASVYVRNCWGGAWGEIGYAWVSNGYLAARCTDVVTFVGAVP